jgi:hypothetical protein
MKPLMTIVCCVFVLYALILTRNQNHVAIENESSHSKNSQMERRPSSASHLNFKASKEISVVKTEVSISNAETSNNDQQATSEIDPPHSIVSVASKNQPIEAKAWSEVKFVFEGDSQSHSVPQSGGKIKSQLGKTVQTSMGAVPVTPFASVRVCEAYKEISSPVLVLVDEQGYVISAAYRKANVKEEIPSAVFDCRFLPEKDETGYFAKFATTIFPGIADLNALARNIATQEK